jgi:hypothetical protein
MNVTEAVATRRSVRAFLPDAVDRATLERVLNTARNSPSGGNVQPWNAVVLSGEPLQRLLAAVAEVLPQGRAAHAPEYDIYPKGLEGAYEARRLAVGEALYGSLAIPREDKAARLQWFARNFQAFGAPVLMLVHTPKYMGPPQWSDIGAQVAIPDEHIFFCGLAIGHRDAAAPVNNFPVPRAPLEESVIFEGF